MNARGGRDYSEDREVSIRHFTPKPFRDQAA